MTETADRPLVTFALFAYNQEQYIREAVEGALAQTYEPLEIILSDDCSTDRTFEIMQEMAAAYEGPHEVRVRRSRYNVGIIDHVLSVAREAQGELLLVAAGDDISYHDRASKITDAWSSESAAAVYSGNDVCDDEGRVIQRNHIPEPLDRIQKLFEGCDKPKRFDGKVRNIPGYSAAYDIEVIRRLPVGAKGANNEDALLTYFINLLGGRITFVKEPLMCRRMSKTSVSARSKFSNLSEIMENERVISKFSRSTLNFYEYFFNLDQLEGNDDYEKVKQRLSNKKSFHELVASFWPHNPVNRVALILSHHGRNELKFIFPRIFGMHIFCFLKYMALRR